MLEFGTTFCLFFLCDIKEGGQRDQERLCLSFWHLWMCDVVRDALSSVPIRTPSPKACCTVQVRDMRGLRASGLDTRQLVLTKRVIYGLAVASLLSVLTLMVYQCLSFFFKEPTYFESKIVPQAEASFPSLTICQEDNGYKEDVLKVHQMLLQCTHTDCTDCPNCTDAQTAQTAQIAPTAQMLRLLRLHRLPQLHRCSDCSHCTDCTD